MESKHLQSMIAINANRITEKHSRIDSALLEAKQFKLINQITRSGPYSVYVDMMAKKAYAIADKTRLELKKAVEMQKALQAELRANRAAEKAAKPIVNSVPDVKASDEQAPGDYNIARDGQPKKDGYYYVRYSANDNSPDLRYYEDGVWYARQNGTKVGFGNFAEDFESEYYIVG